MIGTCIKQNVAAGTKIRQALATSGAHLPQFPCILQPNGSIRLSKRYLAAVQTVDTITELPENPIPTSGLPTRVELLATLGITKSDSSVTHSSHGDIWFGTLGDGAEVVIKFMPVEPGQERRIAESSYVDPFLSWLGSQLVVKGKSTAFAQLYGTFLCQDAFKDLPDAVPQVAMISEVLGDKLDTTVESYMGPEGVQWRKLIAIVLQVMLVLAQAHSMTLVHNDAHLGNCLIAKTCNNKPLYVNVRGRLLVLPMLERVVLMDFGRSTMGGVGESGTARMHSSEVADKFFKWELDNPGADVAHFVAMLMMCQRVPRMLETEAEKPDAPPEARALVRLLRRALQCETRRDMFAAYNECNENNLKGKESTCGKEYIHELRNKETQCMGVTPMDFLMDEALTAPFQVTTPIPPTETIYSPEVTI